MAHRTKLFRNGGSQAVRLPRDCRFPDAQQEVVVRREGRRVVIEPLDVWPSEFLACIGAWPEEIPRPKQSASAKGRDPFA
jgi:virulence-associated protein VagC